MMHRFLCFALALCAAFQMLAQGNLKVLVVESESLEPVMFARLELLRNGRTIAVGYTDAEGLRTLSLPASGDCALLVQAKGFAPKMLSVAPRSQGTTVMPVELTLTEDTVENVYFEEREIKYSRVRYNKKKKE